MRQAWLGVKDAVSLSQRAKDRGEDEDLDKILPKVQLESINTAHWDRYHLLYPPEKDVAEPLVSRLVRELERRALSVPDMSKDKSLAHGQTQAKKQQRLNFPRRST